VLCTLSSRCLTLACLLLRRRQVLLLPLLRVLLLPPLVHWLL
jgi:hypothetical protein